MNGTKGASATSAPAHPEISTRPAMVRATPGPWAGTRSTDEERGR